MRDKNRIKVSFDFDSTLSEKLMQRFAKFLVDNGVEVWITTSRYGNGKEPYPNWNDDLYLAAKRVGITRENVIFCQMSDKYKLIGDSEFVFHVDDDEIELDMIRENTNIVPIWYFGYVSMVQKECANAIRPIDNELSDKIMNYII